MKFAAVVVTLLTLAGCAGAGPGADKALVPSAPTVKPVNLVPDGYTGRFRVNALVLQNDHHGPQLCINVATSLPPQCGGPDIPGWSWTGLKSESANSSTWGDFLLIGKFDGSKFTLTEPPKDRDDSAHGPVPDFTTPCAEPAGGWKPIDLSKATWDAMDQVRKSVTSDPDYADTWIDQKTPALIDGTPANDPKTLVLNVKFTKNIARHEADIRKIWGGALCVSQARHTQVELSNIADQMRSEPGVLSIAPNGYTEIVELRVLMATERRQRELDAQYGPGLVVLIGTLEPID